MAHCHVDDALPPCLVQQPRVYDLYTLHSAFHLEPAWAPPSSVVLTQRHPVSANSVLQRCSGSRRYISFQLFDNSASSLTSLLASIDATSCPYTRFDTNL
jgi:hypothetical protein